MPKALTGESAREVHYDSEASGAVHAVDRLGTLDLVRGVAVLGILAINISGFAGPAIGSASPGFAAAASRSDELAYALGFLFFEGKMRALFAMLFGAGIALYCERMDAAGRDGDVLQVRRLAWLMLLGQLHYLLLWWGDILFVYATCGIAVLFVRRQPCAVLLGLAAGIALTASIVDLAVTVPMARAEEAVRLGVATLAERHEVAARLALYREAAEAQARLYHSGFWNIAGTKLSDDPFWLVTMTLHAWSEVVPLMLVGLVLQRIGVAQGGVPRRTLLTVGVGATAVGLALSALALGWAWPRHFPPIAMYMMLGKGLLMPHLMTALGYGALLLAAAPALLRTRLGMRLAACGQVAFSNYIGTSLLMSALFFGWGLGLYGRVGAAEQWLFVLIGWCVMLCWSAPFLRRYRRGPLELVWRSLVEGYLLPNRRPLSS
ncbi:uncharacterized protein EDF56_103140 [Novosphingobium sp. PhB165]|uniref:DUF418 domain-containing protein n=1 Tax=Novosphingobium sp. PhB165 TaxID=2485105 RepID=UPI00104818DC|nr:DUF418 domain-containing protein [Novosphingobium sp. PhB165]TCM19502.1 uncharacterized protein EDF56_103140 [Novosphingobium sp. PhB165]